MSVTNVKWSGEGLILTASQDRTINVYNSETGKLIRKLLGHGHWINHLALNTDYVLRSGPFDHTGTKFSSIEEGFLSFCFFLFLLIGPSADHSSSFNPLHFSSAQQKALQRYLSVKGNRPERLVQFLLPLSR